MAPTTYEANCHCGAVRYTVTLEDALAPEGTTKVNRCNCSICTKYGMCNARDRKFDTRYPISPIPDLAD